MRAGPPSGPRRLGVYADLRYSREGDAITTDRAFVLFATGLADRVDDLVVFGREDAAPGRSFYELPADVRFVALPDYRRVTDVVGVLRSLHGGARAFRHELGRLDGVWIFGPHPVAILFALMARRRGVPVYLGVRQNLPVYIRNRLPSRLWAWAVGAAWLLEASFRFLSRRSPTVTVGEDLGRAYRRWGGKVLATGFSLIGAGDIVPADEAVERSWEGPLRLVSVGRLDSEKNPLLLAEILALLRGRDPRWELMVIGQGPLEQALRDRAAELGVSDALDVKGYVTNGPELWQLYRGANAFLHVSFTEGLPQVLFEAQAAGTPVVGTDVGGVAAALDGGRSGLLIPPGDAGAAATALERLRDDPELRARLVRAGIEHATRETRDAQLDRIYDFFRSSSST